MDCDYYRKVKVYQTGMEMEMCAINGSNKLRPTTTTLCKRCEKRKPKAKPQGINTIGWNL